MMSSASTPQPEEPPDPQTRTSRLPRTRPPPLPHLPYLPHLLPRAVWTQAPPQRPHLRKKSSAPRHRFSPVKYRRLHNWNQRERQTPMETTGHRTRAARRGQPLGIGPTARSQDVRLSPPRQLPLTQNTKEHLEDRGTHLKRRNISERQRTQEGRSTPTFAHPSRMGAPHQACSGFSSIDPDT